MSTKTSRSQPADRQLKAHRAVPLSESTQVSPKGNGAGTAPAETLGDGLDLGNTEQPDPIVDPEFKALAPPLRTEELAQLERNLREDGCRDALVVWQGHNILLDGHNRLELCRKLGIPYEVKTVELSDRDAARGWMMQNQLGRRNLPPKVAAYYRGKLYLQRKHQGKRTGASGQNAQRSTTAGELAAEYHVDEKTIRRDAQLARRVDAIVQACGDEARVVLLSRSSKVRRGDLKRLAVKPSGVVREAVESLMRTGRLPSEQGPSDQENAEGQAATTVEEQDDGDGGVAEATAPSQSDTEGVSPPEANAEHEEAAKAPEETVPGAACPGVNAIRAQGPGGATESGLGEDESASQKPPQKRSAAKGSGKPDRSAFERLKDAWNNAELKDQRQFIEAILNEPETLEFVRERLREKRVPRL